MRTPQRWGAKADGPLGCCDAREGYRREEGTPISEAGNEWGRQGSAMHGAQVAHVMQGCLPGMTA